MTLREKYGFWYAGPCICHLCQSDGIVSHRSQGGRLKVTTLKYGIDPNT